MDSRRKIAPVVTVSNQDEANNAIANATDKKVNISIASGQTITLDNGIANAGDKSRDITFSGDGSQTVDVIKNAVNAENGMLNYQRGSSFTFENLTIQAGQGDFDGIVCDELTYMNCTIKGKLTLYGKATFINCTFNDRNSGAAGKAAIEIGNDYNATYTLTVNNATVNGFADGKNTGSKLWANKNSMGAANLTVTIDGCKIQ